MPSVKVYGADWCPKTVHALEFLREKGVAFDYINVEQDSVASDWVKEQNGGKEKKPTIDIDGTILTEPSDSELNRALA